MVFSARHQTGTTAMQFLLDLIFDYSCCRHLVIVQPEQEDET